MSETSNSDDAQPNVEEEEEEEDPFHTRINNSGCAKQHYALQVRIILICVNNFLFIIEACLRVHSQI